MMSLIEEQESLYDLLEVTPSATQADIRSAYLRVKAAFRKDSAALYSLMSEEDTDSILRKIENAFQILSSPDRRREYDEVHQLRTNTQAIPPLRPSLTDTPIVSIDRVPPMDRNISLEDVLVPPSTDFSEGQKQTSNFMRGGSLHSPPQSRSLPFQNSVSSFQSEVALTTPKQESESIGFEIQEWIQNETEWSGAFIRRIREAKGTTIEEIAEYSKISRTYIHAIEEEIYEKLPAPVYLRGFLTQIAKYLKIPTEKLITGYLVRYTQMRESRRA